MEEIHSITGFSEGYLPFRYLRVPIASKKIEDFSL